MITITIHAWLVWALAVAFAVQAVLSVVIFVLRILNAKALKRLQRTIDNIGSGD